MDDFLKKLAESFGKAPVSFIVMLIGAAFVITSITTGRYFVESFATFIYGVATTYLWILGRKEEPINPYLYFLCHIVLFAVILSSVFTLKKILVVEDSPTQAEQLRYLLEKHGFLVCLASDGENALALARQRRPAIVISDIVMPRMDGFELTRKLKANSLHKDIPVIIVTTRETDDDKYFGLESGADAYILKSEFTSEGLLETIERLIG